MTKQVRPLRDRLAGAGHGTCPVQDADAAIVAPSLSARHAAEITETKSEEHGREAVRRPALRSIHAYHGAGQKHANYKQG